MRELLHLRLGVLEVVAPVVAVALTLLTLGLPGVQRRRPAPARRGSSLRTDLGYLLLSPVSEAFSRSVTTLALAGGALVAGRHVGAELLAGFGPVVQQPRWLIVVEMLVLGDLVFYWTHRMAHTLPWLWRLHAVHHSTAHMRWSSAFRTHPGETYAQVLHTLPLFMLGFPVDALVPLVPILTVYAAFIHSGLPLSLRRVSYLLNSPVFHRWHHARDVEDGVVNFAGMFPVYDLIFGTYRLPADLPDALGIDEPEMPDTCLGQLVYPFRRRPGARPSERIEMQPFLEGHVARG